MDRKLGEIRKVTKKRKALEVQLNFRKKVLLQKSALPNVFSFSGKDNRGRVRKFSIEKLKENLTELIKESYRGPLEEKESNSQPLLVGKKVANVAL